MSLPRPEDEALCQTDERSESHHSADELVPLGLEIGERIIGLFGYGEVADIVFRLKCCSREVHAVVNGEALPSCEMLLAIQKVTGVSIDWLLTGVEPTIHIEEIKPATHYSRPRARRAMSIGF